MILMLDFDGVLHPDPCFDEAELFGRLSALELILRDSPHVEVVITSDWRNKLSLPRLRELFSIDLAVRVIDVTANLHDHVDRGELIGPTYSREVEIEAWLHQSSMPGRTWVALDDKAQLFQPLSKNLVLCDPVVGIDSHV